MNITTRSTLRSTAARWGIASLLATAAFAAMAQTPPSAPAAAAATPDAPHAGPGHERMHRPDPAKMQAFFAKRLAAQKAQLKITPDQEGAWSTYAAAIQPPAPGERHARMDRADFAKLSTPDRIDRMRAMRDQREAAMDKRGDAVKTFYAALTPDQQKTFDAESLRRWGHGEGRGGPGRPNGPSRG